MIQVESHKTQDARRKTQDARRKTTRKYYSLEPICVNALKQKTQDAEQDHDKNEKKQFGLTSKQKQLLSTLPRVLWLPPLTPSK